MDSGWTEKKILKAFSFDPLKKKARHDVPILLFVVSLPFCLVNWLKMLTCAGITGELRTGIHESVAR